VGIDAACWEYVQPLLDEGLMPSLSTLIGRGAAGVLKSTMPPLTPVAWSTIATGKNPGKHGVFDWIKYTARGSGAVVQPHSFKSEHGVPFWKRLNDAGHRVGLVNVPLTYPPPEINGFVLSDVPRGQSLDDLAYPPGLMTDLETRFGAYNPGKLWAIKQSGQSWFDADLKTQDFQVHAAVYLTKQFNIDLLVINLSLTDHANHLAQDMTKVKRAYCETDRHLAFLLNELQPEHVLLISDHGSRRTKGRFNAGHFLYDQGILNWTRRRPTEGDLNWLLVQLNRRLGLRGITDRVVRKGLRLAMKPWHTSLPTSIAYLIEKLDPPDFRKYAFEKDPDPSVSLFFYHGWGLYVNPGATANVNRRYLDRNLLLETVKHQLMSVKDPESGAPIFSNVLGREEIYSGPFADQGPDLIPDYYDSAWGFSFDPNYVSRGWFMPPNGLWFGDHHPDGLYVFAGKDLVSNPIRLQAQLEDLPATLLYLMGVPIPQDYDGSVLTALVAPERLRAQRVQFQPGDDEIHRPGDEGSAYSPEQEAAMLESLRALGYVD
jgi:predicted AlkP superfamily phosphohydrolase/phosphomutase